jgi:hypothetical protein
MWHPFVGYLTIVYQLLMLPSVEFDDGMIVYNQMESNEKQEKSEPV